MRGNSLLASHLERPVRQTPRRNASPGTLGFAVHHFLVLQWREFSERGQYFFRGLASHGWHAVPGQPALQQWGCIAAGLRTVSVIQSWLLSSLQELAGCSEL